MSGAFTEDGTLTMTWAPPAAGTFSGTIEYYVFEFQPVQDTKNATWAYGTATLNTTTLLVDGSSTSKNVKAGYLFPFKDYHIRAATLLEDETNHGLFSEKILVQHPFSVPSGQPQNVQVTQPSDDPFSYPPSATQLIVTWESSANLWVNNTPIQGFEITATANYQTTPIVEVHAAKWHEDDPEIGSFSSGLTRLQPNTEYKIVVCALGKGGKSEPSLTVTGKTREYFPSQAPSNVSLLERNTNNITLVWQPMSRNHLKSNGEIIGYSIHKVSTGDIDCVGVRCGSVSQCQVEPQCEFGECIYGNQPNGTLCDDGNPETEHDQCMDGVCIGIHTGKHTQRVELSRTMVMNTRSSGAGYMPLLEEYWFPLWSGSWIYRWDKSGNYIQRFTAGGSSNSIRQLWGEVNTTFYYVARWSNRLCAKLGPYPTSTVHWTFSPPGSSSVGGVSADEHYVYCMETNSPHIYVLDKDNGQQVKVVTLNGGVVGTLNGALAVIKDKIYYGTGNMFYRYNLDDGEFDGFSFQVATSISNMFFTGNEICLSSGGSNIYCYRVGF